MAYLNKFGQNDDYRREELIRIIEHSVEKLTLQELEALYYDMSFLRRNHRSFLRSGFVATSSMNRDVNQEGQAVFGSLKGVKVIGKRTNTVIDVTSSTLQA